MLPVLDTQYALLRTTGCRTLRYTVVCMRSDQEVSCNHSAENLVPGAYSASVRMRLTETEHSAFQGQGTQGPKLTQANGPEEFLAKINMIPHRACLI